MGLRMSWTVDGAIAGAHFDDVETAAKTLCGAAGRVTRIYGRHERQLRKSARLLSQRLLTEGREAVEAGRSWSDSDHDVSVTLMPTR